MCVFCIGFIGFMLAGKKLTDYTNLFSPYDFKNNDNIVSIISKMNKSNSIECNSIETIDKTDLSERTKFRLDEISKIENYFIKEINQRKSCSSKLNKYIAVFEYIYQALVVLRATSCRVSIFWFTSIVGAPVGIASASLTLFFSLTRGIVKKLLNITRKKRKSMIKFLCWLKPNSIETFISQALIDMDMSNEEYVTILKEKDKYEKMKDNLRSENGKYVSNGTSYKGTYEMMRLSSVKSKI